MSLADARKLKGNAGDTPSSVFGKRLLDPTRPSEHGKAIHTAGHHWPMEGSTLANTAARKATFATQVSGTKWLAER
ncbi:hypothetical protein E2P81_ATG11476 [Venturia nashicola]|nr:hypothetical protein E2P81_ATG11476 [Venturia nashicola]